MAPDLFVLLCIMFLVGLVGLLAGIGLGRKGVSPWWALRVSFGIALIFSIAVSAFVLWAARQPPGYEANESVLAVLVGLIVLVPGFVVAQVATYIGYRLSQAI